MDEIWRAIPGFPLYEASSHGRVRSLKTGTGTGSPIGSGSVRILAAATTGNGYAMINLKVNGKSVNKYVHRLVALTFVEEIASKLQVNHINGDKQDNRLSNLEIVTQNQNMAHRRDVLKQKVKARSGCRLNKEQVLAIRAHRAEGLSMAKIASMYGVSHATVSYIISRKNWNHV